MDRLIHATENQRKISELAWHAAMPDAIAKPRLDKSDQAALNAMVLISHRDLSHVSAGSRGAVSTLPRRMTSAKNFTAEFGDPPDDLIWEYLQLKGKNKDDDEKKRDVKNSVSWRLVGYSAACDFAQGKVPENLRKVFLALEVPTSTFDICKLIEPKPERLFALPEFVHDNSSCRLIFNWHRETSVGKGFRGAKVIYRLREPLISALISVFHNHGSRLGFPAY